ncbi:MAG TPA: hypothetical protein VKS60_14085 [Stellaceae bacterium]|nr:hypothetical protein [Stellaceae bacterium]
MISLAGTASADEAPAPPNAAPFASQLRSGGVLLGTNSRFASHLAFDFSENILGFSSSDSTAPDNLREPIGAPPTSLADIESLDNESPADAAPSPVAGPVRKHAKSLRNQNGPGLDTSTACPWASYRRSGETPFWARFATDAAWSVGRKSSFDTGGPTDTDVAPPVTEATGELAAHRRPGEWCSPSATLWQPTTPFPPLLISLSVAFVLGFLVFHAVRGFARP